jgi:hypothetical protein
VAKLYPRAPGSLYIASCDSQGSGGVHSSAVLQLLSSGLKIIPTAHIVKTHKQLFLTGERRFDTLIPRISSNAKFRTAKPTLLEISTVTRKKKVEVKLLSQQAMEMAIVRC